MESGRPNYCPNCGEALPEGENFAMPIIYPGGDGGHDVYCGACGWSGDVLPDSEQGAHAGEGLGAPVAAVLPTHRLAHEAAGEERIRRS